MSSESLLERAAEAVRRFVEKYRPYRLYVFFSAGKDSTAALAATVYAGPEVVRRTVVVYNELVGNTAMINVETARRIAEKLGFENIVTVESPPYERITLAVWEHKPPFMLHIRARARGGESFWEAVEKWGPPVLISGERGYKRWCYSEFKARHWERLPPERRGKELYRFMVVGVKATDSHWRYSRWVKEGKAGEEMVRRFRSETYFGSVIDVALSPILYMSTEEVWQLLREAGLHGELVAYEYYEDSLNCIICPLRPEEKQVRIIQELVRRGQELEKLRRAYEAISRLRVLREEGKKTKTAQFARKWREMLKALEEARA